MAIRLKRAYDPPAEDDGYRVLVDRLWPRGLTKERADIDLWLRGIAPTTELRKWYGHSADRWREFQVLYREELLEHGDLLDLVHDLEKDHGTVTLVFGAKDVPHSHANVILDTLME